jgi:hypothetical protein
MTCPVVLTRAMRPFVSVYHRLPSGPVATQINDEDSGIQLKTPAVVIRPASGAALANHRAPSGPVVMPMTPGLGMPGVGDGTANSLMTPPRVIRPILPPGLSENHTAAPGPAVTS